MLTKNDEDKVRRVVIDAIQEVIIPVLDDTSTKEDLKKLEGKLESRLDTVERKLDLMNDKLLDHDLRLKNHNQRIGKLEAVATSP